MGRGGKTNAVTHRVSSPASFGGVSNPTAIGEESSDWRRYLEKPEVKDVLKVLYPKIKPAEILETMRKAEDNPLNFRETRITFTSKERKRIKAMRDLV